MIIPLDISDNEEQVYKVLYKKSNFSDMTCKYTINQIIADSNPIYKFTIQKVRTILKKLHSKGYLIEIKKGSKGNPTICKIPKLIEINQHESNAKVTVKQHESNNQNQVIPIVSDIKQHESNTNVTIKQHETNNPINDNDNDNDNKDICLEFEIFNHWNDKSKVINHNESTFKSKKSKITTAIKKYGKENIINAIDRMALAVNDEKYFYNNKWSLFNFIKQDNGINNWLDDGQYWNNYSPNINKVNDIKEESKVDYETEKLLKQRREAMKGL